MIQQIVSPATTHGKYPGMQIMQPCVAQCMEKDACNTTSLSMCQYLRHVPSSTTTALQVSPIGISAGLTTRKAGAAVMRTGDALALGMEATTFMRTWFMELVTHMEKSMTVMQDFPIGCKDGLTLRRTGAATVKTRDASSSTAPVRNPLTICGQKTSDPGAVPTSKRLAPGRHFQR